MKKVVINSCYGGFSLSPLAVKKWAELKGKDCYFFVNERKRDGSTNFYRYKRVSEDEAENAFMWIAFDVPNPNDVLISQEHWHDMSDEEKKSSSAVYEKHNIYHRDIERDDPDLIKVVEELGDLADGSHAELKIVEIPDDVEYVIQEYDGNEWVAEQHRTWS